MKISDSPLSDEKDHLLSKATLLARIASSTRILRITLLCSDDQVTWVERFLQRTFIRFIFT